MSRRRAAHGAARRLVRAACVVLAASPVLGCRESAPVEARPLVASPRHDFGRVAQGETLRHAFVAHNASNAPLVLETTPEVLGCRAVAPRPLAPGGDGKIVVTCQASVPGPLRVSLPLRASGRLVGELSIAAEVEPALAFEPRAVSLALPFGEKRSSEVRLRGVRAKAARLSPPSAPPGVELRVLPGDGERGEGIALDVLGESVGTRATTLTFATGLEAPREVSLPFAVKVTGTLAVSPTNPVLDLSAPGPKRVVLRVTSSQPGFAISRVSILEGPFTASVRRADGGFEVEVGVVEAKLSPGESGVNGRLRITSNDRTEGKKDVPLFALGKPPGAPGAR